MATLQETLSPQEVFSAHHSLRQIATGFWAARVVHVAVDVNLFELLKPSPLEAQSIAEQLGMHPRGVVKLCDALVSLGLLTRTSNGYRNSPIASTFLIRESAYYQGDLIRRYSQDWHRWEALDTILRDGLVRGPQTPTLDAPTLNALGNYASVVAPLLAEQLDLTKCQQILEIAGGTAVYALALADAKPDAEILVLEQETTSSAAMDALHVMERIQYRACDYLKTDLGLEQFNMVLISNVFHRHSLEDCRQLLRKAFAALTSEGQCVFSDIHLRDDRSGPLEATVYALDTLLQSQDGEAFSTWDITDLMQGEGFIRMQVIPLEPSAHTLVVGLRP